MVTGIPLLHNTGMDTDLRVACMPAPQPIIIHNFYYVCVSAENVAASRGAQHRPRRGVQCLQHPNNPTSTQVLPDSGGH